MKNGSLPGVLEPVQGPGLFGGDCAVLNDSISLIASCPDSVGLFAPRDEEFRWYKELLNRLEHYLVPIIILVGLAGNTFSFTVFVATHLKGSSCNIYLASLAVADNLFLFCVSVSWGQHLGLSLYSQQAWCQTLVYFTHVASFLSVWYVMAFTVERYMVVCHPLRTTLCTAQMAKKVVVLLAACSLLGYSFTTFTSGVMKLNGSRLCVPMLRYYRAVFTLNTIDTAITLVVPTAVIIGCNIRIMHVVWSCYKHNRRMRSVRVLRKWNFGEPRCRNVRSYGAGQGLPTSGLPITRSSHIRATRMLLIVSTVFLLCNLPSHALRGYVIFMQVASTASYQPPQSVMLCQQLFNIIYYLNFSVNFFLYSLSSRSFRVGMQRLWVKIHKRRRGCECRKRQRDGSPRNSPRYISTKSEYFAPSARSLHIM